MEGIVRAFSRGNIQIITINHLLEECKVFLTFLPPGSAIDCELFHHALSFEEITSIGRTVNEVHPLMPMLELYIFDVYLTANPPFEERRRMLVEAMKKYREKAFNWVGNDEHGGRIDAIADYRDKDAILSGVPRTKSTTKLFLTESHQVHSLAEIIDLHKSYVNRGYEGSMIKRQANGAQPGSVDYRMSTYLFGKGTRILKLKDKLTAEATCVEVNEAKGRERGCAVLVLQMDNGKRFSVRMKGSLERRRELLRHPELALNKPVTYEYQNLTIHGIPRFPVGVEIRDYEPGFPFPLAPPASAKRKVVQGDVLLPSIDGVD
jgi:ATP-dependent DNA ligase